MLTEGIALNGDEFVIAEVVESWNYMISTKGKSFINAKRLRSDKCWL